MKKILIIIPLLMGAVFAQDATTKVSDAKAKPDKTDQSVNPLDGKAFKVTFTMAGEADKKMNTTQRKIYNKKKASNEVGDANYDKKELGDQAAVSETGPLANKHAVLRFENGMVHSSVLNKQNMSGCAYRVTATGANQLYSFTSNCAMNSTGNSSVTPPVNPASTGTVTEEFVPEGTNPQQNSVSTPVQQNTSSNVTAALSGLIDGSAINGTLTCWTADGKMVKYSFRGTKASKSEINSESSIGMK